MQSRPVLFDDLVPVWNAFATLSAHRQSGWSAAPIAVSDIHAWLSIYGVTDTDLRMEYFELISAMDSFWLEHMAKKREDKNGDSAANHRRNKGKVRSR